MSSPLPLNRSWTGSITTRTVFPAVAITCSTREATRFHFVNTTPECVRAIRGMSSHCSNRKPRPHDRGDSAFRPDGRLLRHRKLLAIIARAQMVAAASAGGHLQLDDSPAFNRSRYRCCGRVNKWTHRETSCRRTVADDCGVANENSWTAFVGSNRSRISYFGFFLILAASRLPSFSFPLGFSCRASHERRTRLAFNVPAASHQPGGGYRDREPCSFAGRIPCDRRFVGEHNHRRGGVVGSCERALDVRAGSTCAGFAAL